MSGFLFPVVFSGVCRPLPPGLGVLPGRQVGLRARPENAPCENKHNLPNLQRCCVQAHIGRRQ
jgi:hypothetical protein